MPIKFIKNKKLTYPPIIPIRTNNNEIGARSNIMIKRRTVSSNTKQEQAYETAEYLPDSETEGLPADLSEFLELAVELVDEAVPSEHSETLRRFERRAAAAAVPGPQEEPVGALELSPWRPWRPCNPCRPVWFVSCSSRRLRNLCSRDSCSLCTACLRSRSSRLCKHNYCMRYCSLKSLLIINSWKWNLGAYRMELDINC